MSFNRVAFDTLIQDLKTERSRVYQALSLVATELSVSNIEIADILLSASIQYDKILNPDRQFLILIFRQNSAGGFNVTFSLNPDKTKKWKGVSGLVLTTTANTYTAILFYVKKSTEAIYLGSVTGKDL